MPVTPESAERELVPRSVAGARSLRVAALLVATGGLVSLWGSFQTWGYCSSEPCGGALQHLFPRTGVEFGPGVATALAGGALAVLGVLLAARGGPPSVAPIAFGLAVIEGVAIAIHVVAAYLFREYRVYGPEIGLVAVIAGTAVSVVATLSVLRSGVAARVYHESDRD